MGGFFGAASTDKCISELFYGTDYHSHLGTRRGGLAMIDKQGVITGVIHDISNAQFKSKFDDDLKKLKGNIGIGVISDYEDQPLIISSHLGTFAIATVGRINNAEAIKQGAFRSRNAHFTEMSGAAINPTELVASLISRKDTFTEGLEYAQERIDGSCSILLLTTDGIYAARDRMGRTPIILGEKENGYAVTMETTAFPNLDYSIKSYLGPGEILLVQPDKVIQKRPPRDEMKICAFLWVYYGYPSSYYEDINTETVRYCNGEKIAEMDDVEIDSVAGIPDSGIGHAIGYSHAKEIPYTRPFVKYTPTWPRSFMPQDQNVRDLVAQMKLIPVQKLIKGKKLLFCDDSIVRGTQLKDTVKRLFESGAEEIHMRSSCPPLIFGCKFLNFSLSRSVLDLAARRAIRTLEGSDDPAKVDYDEYLKFGSEKYLAMVDVICKELGLTTLKYQSLDNLIEAIGLPKEKICTYCWNEQG
jgi:amidophosphoribosyltransferase